MKRALICGVSGQDGAYLAELLLTKGYEVFGTSRDAQLASFSNLLHLGVRDRVQTESMAGNDFRSVLQVLMKVRPDEIYNLAGQSSVGLSFGQPVETLESISVGTLNLLEGMRILALPARYYNAGSGECFGDTGGVPANERTPFRPRSPYAVAKAAAHWVVANYRESYQLFAWSGILFNHQSPFRRERFVTQKIVATACRIASGSGEVLPLGNMDIQRDWGWAPEYVEAMWQMLQQAEPNDYVIATGETHSLRDFVAEAFGVLGIDWKPHVMTDAALIRPSEIMVSRGDPQEAASKLGWSARTRMAGVVELMVRGQQAMHTSVAGRGGPHGLT